MTRHFARAVLAIACVAPVGVPAQRPTPIERRDVVTRLPKPENLTVRQNAQGYVELSWSPVSGAKTYVLGRSVGTNGYQRVNEPLAGATQFIDGSVPAGTRVSYIVTPVDSAGIAGLRATSADFTPVAVTPPTPSTASAQPVATRVEGMVEVRWTATPPTDHYEVSHLVNGREVSNDRVGLRHELAVPATPGEHRFVVVSFPPVFGTKHIRTSKAVIVEAPAPQPAADSTPSVSPSPTPSGSAPGGATPVTTPGATTPAPPSEVSVTVASPVTLRVGTTAQVTVPGSQWVSLDAAVARVNTEGLVTARTAGTARIVALTPQAAGAMRVTVVHVTVLP